jgi:hypothetical protein
MCELMTALAIGGTIMGAAGQIQQGQAAAASARYNAKIGEMNATLAERRSRDALQRGAIEEQRKRMEVGRIRGQQTAAMAATGVDVGFGSPLDLIVDTSVLGELDALTIRTNAYRESYEHKVDAANKRAGANLSLMQGQNAMTSGYLSAGGTVLTGAGKAYEYYSRPAGYSNQPRIGSIY